MLLFSCLQMKVAGVSKSKIEEVMREARLMRNLRHKNIVRCYGVSADSEPLMILMEFVQGGSLDVYLKTRGVKILNSERVQMIYDAANGIVACHGRGIIHR